MRRILGTPDCRTPLFDRWLQVLLFVLILQLAGCGGGGGNSQPPPPPPPDFSLSVTPQSTSVAPGSSASVSVSASPVNGFSGQVSVSTSGLPSGVSASPSAFTLTPGTKQQVIFSAPQGAATATGSVTFSGTSGTLSHTVKLSLSVTGPLSNIPPSRTRYVRTDATTEYFTWINSQWAIYNPPTSRFFITDPVGSHVYVMDSATETESASIAVPGAYGIDDTPDHSRLYVGTVIGDVYEIDPVAMAVTHRYIASQIGPDGYPAFNVAVMADGQLALLGAQQGIFNVDGSGNFAIWNPITNALSVYDPIVCGGLMGRIGGFNRSADRTKVVMGSIDSDGTLCEVDEGTGQGLYTAATEFSLYHILTSPDGKYIILPSYPNDAVLYDAKTLNLVARFPVNGDTSSGSGFAVTADSTTLLTPSSSIGFAYSLTSRQPTGWFPNFNLPPISGGSVVTQPNSPAIQAVDGTGLFAGPMEEGVGFIDFSAVQTGAAGTAFPNAFLSPAAGPVSGGTQTQGFGYGTLPLNSVYFGGQQATNVSAASTGDTATTPPGLPGPADVYAFAADGGLQITPEAFSYGPTILEITPNMSTAEGGGTGYIFGYGLGPVTSNNIPPNLQVTVGGTPATVTLFGNDAYQVSPYPFPLQAFFYTIPSGVTGPASVTVTNNYGIATINQGLTYLPAVQQFSLPSASLVQGIYDPHRNLYYFTDTSKIQVFSLAQKQWLTPIPIPAPAGATQRLWGLALSPNGNNLAISDLSAGVIYLLNPSNPSLVKTFPVSSVQSQVVSNPCGVAVSDTGIVYFMVVVIGGTGYQQYFKLNANTGAITDFGLGGPGTPGSDQNLRNSISYDNSRVFNNMTGYVFSIDTATDTILPATSGPSCCGDYDLSLSANQTSLEASSYLFDTDLNARSFYALNDREIQFIGYVYGAKLSPDGTLLFQPSTNGIDVLDGRLGNLLDRVALPFALSTNYDALVTDSHDNILIAITGTTGSGIAVVDLTSIPEPAPLPYARKLIVRPRQPGPRERKPVKSITPAHSDSEIDQLTNHLRAIPHITK